MIQIGSHVSVDRRKFPGMNKEGGIGKVVSISDDGNFFKVKYVLGGSESNIPAHYVHLHDQENDSRRNCRGRNPSTNEYHFDNNNYQEQTRFEPIIETAQVSSMHGIFEDQTPISFNVGDHVTVDARMQPGMNKPGGAARITHISPDGLISVEYIINKGKESDLHPMYVRRQTNQGNRETRNVVRSGSTESTATKSLTKEYSSLEKESKPKKPRVEKLQSSDTNVISLQQVRNQNHSTKPTLEFAKVVATADLKDLARQTTFTQIVAKLFRIHKADMFEKMAMYLLVNNENSENEPFSESEFTSRLDALDKENRIMLREKDGIVHVWQV